MKDFFKRFFIRLSITTLFIFVILTIIDKVIYCTTPEYQWRPEDNAIIEMNNQKLANSTWEGGEFISKFIDEGDLPPKGDKKRILVVGDSFVWGHGYSNLNHVWWKQLGRVLYENGYTDVEVVAAGASGFNTEQQLNLILLDRDLMAEVDADLIIVGYVENDPQIRDENNKDLLRAIENTDLFYEYDIGIINAFKTLWPNIYAKLSDRLVKKYSHQQWFIQNFGLQYNKWTLELTQGKWATLYKHRVLLPLSYYIEYALDVPLFFLPLPSFPGYSLENMFIVSALGEYNIPHYNMINDFVTAYPDEEYSYLEWGINPANGHPSVKTTQFFADWTLNLLESKYPDIIGEKHSNVDTYLDINDWLPYKLNVRKLEDNYYKITYPKKDSEDSFLNLPLKKDYVKLSLKFPINIKSIEITGDNIKEIDLYVTEFNNELGYDTQELISIGSRKGNFKWKLSGDKSISTINISAKVKSGDSTDMYIKINY